MLEEWAKHYYEAFTVPSMDFFWTYIRVMLFVSLMAICVWHFYLKPKYDTSKAVSFDDIGVDAKFVKDDSDGAKDLAGTSTKGDTKDTTNTAPDAIEATEYRSMSLKREYLQRGPFALSDSSDMLTKEAHAKVQAILFKHVWIKFHITQRELLENRYGLYQDRRMKEYDKMISTQVTKFVRELDILEEKALVYLQIEERILVRSDEKYARDSYALKSLQEAYEKELHDVWKRKIPDKTLTRTIAVEGYAIDLMNIVKIPPVLVKSLETSIGLYLNDYYMVYDAAKEDHDVRDVQLMKAIKEYSLDSEDKLVSNLKEFKRAVLSRFNIRASQDDWKPEIPLDKAQLKAFKLVVQKIKVKFRPVLKNEDVLIFYDFLQLTAITVQLASKFYTESTYKRKMERRAFLIRGELAHYKLSVQTYQRRLQQFRQMIINEILAHFKIPADMWNRSAIFYALNAVFAPQLNSIVNNFPFKHMIIKNEAYNELKKGEMYSMLISLAEKKEDIFVSMLQEFMNGSLKAADVPQVLDERHTKMYDDIWLETGLEEEEIFNDFYDHKCPFNARYIECRDQSWRRLSKKLLKVVDKKQKK